MSEKPEDAAEIRRHCYHEAGHAICMLVGGIGVRGIVISEAASFVDPVPNPGELFYRLRAALAGGVAQQRFTHLPPEPMHLAGDAEPIDRYLEWLATDAAPAKVRADAESDAEFVVEKYWEAITVLAERLAALPVTNGERRMSGDEFRDLVLPLVQKIKNGASQKPPDVATGGAL